MQRIGLLMSGDSTRNQKAETVNYRCTIDGRAMEYSTGTADINEAEKVARARFMPIAVATQEEVLAGYVAETLEYKAVS